MDHTTNEGPTMLPDAADEAGAAAADQTRGGPEFQQIWDALPAEDKLSDIFVHCSDPAQWLEADCLEVFAAFYHDKAVWGLIKAKAKELGASPFDLEEAVKQLVRRQARAQVLDALREGDATLTPEELTAHFTESEWLQDDTLAFLARFYDDAPTWMRLKVMAKKAGINAYDLDRAVKQLHTHALGRNGAAPASPLPPLALAANGLPEWRQQLLTNSRGEPSQNAANIALILAHHPAWKQTFWWDSVRLRPMVGTQALNDKLVCDIAQWLGIYERMGCSQLRLIERCILAQCQNTPRDLLKEWLAQLPDWDQQPRLRHWLARYAGTEATTYGEHVSASLPVAMVARALAPGVLYRHVVILEGPEEFKKSTLVAALGGEEWTVELSIGLDSKEAHMMLQGAWVAELSELDSYTKTEETKLKAYFSARKDSYIPKYSNLRVDQERRTIFVATTNEDIYLKGLGNTRYLPIKVQTPVDVEAFLAEREQIFAEALGYCRSHPGDWWAMSFAAEAEAIERREDRRVSSIYEDALRQWLDEPPLDEILPNFTPPPRVEITWAEIAERFLKIDREHWKDSNLQRQIANALRGIGWQQIRDRRGGKQVRVWRRIEVSQL